MMGATHHTTETCSFTSHPNPSPSQYTFMHLTWHSKQFLCAFLYLLSLSLSVAAS